MCARLTLTNSADDLVALFGLDSFLSAATARPRFNVAPTQTVPVVRLDRRGDRELVPMAWGLVPHWNTNPKHRGFVNARAETAPDKPAFRDPFRLRRCLVPAGGFYEWERVGKARQPYYVTAADGRPLAIAALWDRWEGSEGAVEGVAVLTVAANDLVRPLHTRMPAVVAPEDFAAWLDARERDPANLLPLLHPSPSESLRRWPVDRRVNSAAVDEPGLTAPVELPDRPRQPSLFDAA